MGLRQTNWKERNRVEETHTGRIVACGRQSRSKPLANTSRVQLHEGEDEDYGHEDDEEHEDEDEEYSLHHKVAKFEAQQV